MLFFLRSLRLISREIFISLISLRNLDILSLILRRSVSILVSPGPRPPIPPVPPDCRDKDSPQPRNRGNIYDIWANSTCALPSRLFACCAKISKINAVRSTTLTLTFCSRVRSCAGDNSPSQITVSAPVATTAWRTSVTFPEPIKVAGSGLSRR